MPDDQHDQQRRNAEHVAEVISEVANALQVAAPARRSPARDGGAAARGRDHARWRDRSRGAGAENVATRQQTERRGVMADDQRLRETQEDTMTNYEQLDIIDRDQRTATVRREDGTIFSVLLDYGDESDGLIRAAARSQIARCPICEANHRWMREHWPDGVDTAAPHLPSTCYHEPTATEPPPLGGHHDGGHQSLSPLDRR